MSAIWGIHVTGIEGDRMFRERGMIGIGWQETGDLKQIPADRESYKALMERLLPNNSRGNIINAASQLFRFVNEMEIHDWIVYRSRFDRQIYVGRIAGDYHFAPDKCAEYPQIRGVSWVGNFPPSLVSQGALHELGSALTLFQLKNYGEEFVKAALGETAVSEEQDVEDVARVTVEVEQTTEDFILRSLARHLKGHSFQAFVANLLNTMGYRTIESDPGPDEGIDIIAHRDELKLEPPIIKVQVKSGEGSVGRPATQALLGTLGNGEYGLLVTLGTYAKQATDFARSKPNIRLLDGSELVSLILDHYEQLSPRFRAIIPLKRVYVPSPSEESKA